MNEGLNVGLHTKSGFVASLVYPNPDGSVHRHEVSFSIDEYFPVRAVEPNSVWNQLGSADGMGNAGRERRGNEDDGDDAEETHLSNGTVDDNLAWRRIKPNLMRGSL